MEYGTSFALSFSGCKKKSELPKKLHNSFVHENKSVSTPADAKLLSQ